MDARSSWTLPAVSLNELDRQILKLCAPVPTFPPPGVDEESLLSRAVTLDVFPLAFHRLRHSPRGLPETLPPHWEERFRANAARNLFLHTEQQRLLGALASAGVRALPLKGTWLAEAAYGDLALRTQADIDLYVSPRQLPAALRLFESSRYQRAAPAELEPEQLAATGDEFTSECSFESASGGMPILVELHWRILPMSEAELERTCATAAGIGLPTELNWLYLCLQNSADRWSNLKSLTDLAHWMARQPPDWEPLLAAAGRLGLRRVLWITLAALQTYFDIPAPNFALAALASARPRSLAAVANPFAPPSPLSPAATHRLRLGLRERFRDRLRYVAHLLRPTPSDLAAVRLPRSLSFAYWGVRWLRVAGLLPATPKPAPAMAHP